MAAEGGELQTYEEGENWEGEEAWGEEGEWDDEEGDWDYDDDDYDDDDDDEYDEYGEVALQIRPQMGGKNRMRNVGIHTIEIYHPQFYMKQIEMEEFDARPDRYGPSVIGKYTKGIGQIEGRYCTDDEDPVSFCMTVIHRVVERMQREGWNETSKWSEDGSQLACWDSIGRLDIGSESLIDRSKSMKSYCMDLFERYGNCDWNIEGVDMYNACYGGQAAGLCAQNWVESDRWDGRYGMSIATDISEAPHEVMFCVGAAAAGTLFYPDAPLPHHAHRCSAIMHRFDFFKPVGWFHMGPVVDGKYSIDAYMNAVDTCYVTLRKKMNDRPLLQISDYNVFHTGGGYHIVKKAFERCIRAEDPKTSKEVRDKYVQEKLIPSTRVLKIIGPCHTVSSFLNISSVIRGEWEKALGKILIVFTYGSGCAASMYQLRFDDFCWMNPWGEWLIDSFYREAMYQTPDCKIHQIYIDTWMKFDYRPYGRKVYGLKYDTLQKDVYYLMEIDPWGRRYYHRGGMRTGSLPSEFKLNYDKLEGRKMRKHFDDMPENGVAWEKEGATEEDKVKQLEERWKALEFEMTYDVDADAGAAPHVVDDKFARNNRDHNIVMMHSSAPSEGMLSLEKDGDQHTYQIVGTWTCMKEAQEMTQGRGGSFSFEMTLGANGWEQFFLIQDGDWNRKIYPAFEKSWKDMPCVGPHKGARTPQYWCLTGDPGDDVPTSELGAPGDRYMVTFAWDSVKKLTWEKLADRADYVDDAEYFISGSWTCWDQVALTPSPREPGCYSIEAQKTPLDLEFQLLRNGDSMQTIYPDIDEGFGDCFSKVTVDEGGAGKLWSAGGENGDKFRIVLRRDPEDLSAVSVYWEKTGHAPVEQIPNRYFLVGTPNSWGSGGKFHELHYDEANKVYAGDVPILSIPTEFKILENKRRDRCIHPDKGGCTQIQAHEVKGPDVDDRGLHWNIGKSVADKARVGDTFTVRLELGSKMSVKWQKKQ